MLAGWLTGSLARSLTGWLASICSKAQDSGVVAIVDTALYSI